MANKSLAQLIRDWGAARADMAHIATRIPDMVGVVNVEVAKDNFRLQAYDDGSSRTRWEKRLPSTNRRYDLRQGVKGTVYNAAAKILSQSLNLRDSIHYKKRGPTDTWVGCDLSIVPYAQIHNEGLMGSAWGKYPFKMAKRQFMPLASEGANKKMITQCQKKVTFELGKALRKFKLPGK